MKAKTLTALQGSIKKWEAIVAGTGEDAGTRNCPLCIMFVNKPDECAGCPVREQVGSRFCHRTPYDRWRRALPNPIVRPLLADTPKRLGIAKAELDFLRSLLPKDAP